MVNKTPKVGISLLAYNQGPFVQTALESLKQQTFQDFEIFLVDDGSNDGITPDILRGIEYDKITKKYLYEQNAGNAKRRREQYARMKNEYILDFCGDDVLAPEYLEKTVEFLDKHADYGAVSVNIKFFDETPECAYGEHKYDSAKMDLPHILARNQVLGTSLTRKKALDQADLSGGFTRYQDWDRWISIIEVGWKIGLVPEFLFYYRQVQSSLSHAASIEDEMDVRRKLLKKHADSYRKYYVDVIENMEYAFLEMQQGKNWLEGKYFELNKEIERQDSVIKDLSERRIDKRLKRKIKGLFG